MFRSLERSKGPTLKLWPLCSYSTSPPRVPRITIHDGRGITLWNYLEPCVNDHIWLFVPGLSTRQAFVKQNSWRKKLFYLIKIQSKIFFKTIFIISTEHSQLRLRFGFHQRSFPISTTNYHLKGLPSLCHWCIKVNWFNWFAIQAEPSTALEGNLIYRPKQVYNPSLLKLVALKRYFKVCFPIISKGNSIQIMLFYCETIGRLRFD